MLLPRQELGIINPYPRHQVHLYQASLVKLIHDFVVCDLLHEVKLFHVEPGLLEVVEPELVAMRQVAECPLVQTCALFEVVDRLSHDCIPPRSEVVDIRHPSRLD